jgi:hypothetical protein
LEQSRSERKKISAIFPAIGRIGKGFASGQETPAAGRSPYYWASTACLPDEQQAEPILGVHLVVDEHAQIL